MLFRSRRGINKIIQARSPTIGQIPSVSFLGDFFVFRTPTNILQAGIPKSPQQRVFQISPRDQQNHSSSFTYNWPDTLGVFFRGFFCFQNTNDNHTGRYSKKASPTRRPDITEESTNSFKLVHLQMATYPRCLS